MHYPANNGEEKYGVGKYAYFLRQPRRCISRNAHCLRTEDPEIFE
jgi:hypothetical protein